MENLLSTPKKKYIGIRVSYDDYMSVITHAQNLGVTITDFLMSLILPVIDKQVKPTIKKGLTSLPEKELALIIQENNPVELLNDNKISFQTKRKLISATELFPLEHEKLLQSYLIKL